MNYMVKITLQETPFMATDRWGAGREEGEGVSINS